MKNRNTVGMDMGDRKNTICILNHKGQVLKNATISNTIAATNKYFKDYEPSLFAIEAGTHSPWMSNLLEEMGHEVLVGNPRKLRMIWDVDDKSDKKDAEMLARIARFDPALLHPIKHRSYDTQIDFVHIKGRDQLVSIRSQLISHVRGIVKGFGERVNKCSTPCFHKRARKDLSTKLVEVVGPVLGMIEQLTSTIRDYDKKIGQLCNESYPETKILQQVEGIGPITALSYVLTIEDPSRFKKSRDVGAFFGLTPKRDQSGQIDKQLRITKSGSRLVRRLLVGSAQYILGHFGQDCELRELGLKLTARGGKNAKNKAAVAVARRLAVLLHRLWTDEAEYHKFHQIELREKRVA